MNLPIEAVHDVALLYAEMVRALEAEGIRVEQRNDFAAFAEVYGRQAGKPAYPIFDPAQSDVSAENGFWQALVCDGEVVGLQAMRRWRMELGLAYHLRQHVRLYCSTTDIVLDPSKTRVNEKALAHLVGWGWYHGQIWLDPRFRAREVGGMPLGRRLLPRLATYAAALRGPIDFTWGMAPDPAAEKGLIASYGFYANDLSALGFRDAAGNLL